MRIELYNLMSHLKPPMNLVVRVCAVCERGCKRYIEGV